MNTASSNTQQAEISAQSDGRVVISSQEIQTSGKWQTRKSVTTSNRGSQWNTLQSRGKKANVTAAKSSQLYCKIFNAQHTKRDNFIQSYCQSDE